MSVSLPTPVDVEIIIDLQGSTFTPTTRDDFGELWDEIEALLIGRDLRQRPTYELTSGDKTVRLDVVRVADSVGVVGPATRFGVVGVREIGQVRHRCRTCAADGVERYGSFVCRACRADPGRPDDHVCEIHVSILDGSLITTCAEHRPDCAGCALAATFRCSGPRCASKGTAWCSRHRLRHPHDPDLDYCPPCFDLLFPACVVPGCVDLGTIGCEHIEATGRACGRRTCTRHGSRWQVFGGERLGLGRCDRHQDLDGLQPLEVLRQIVAGAAGRRAEQIPTLRGFAYNLRRRDHGRLALDYDRIVKGLETVSTGLRQDRAVTTAVDRVWPQWRRQHVRITEDHRVGRDVLARLQRIAPKHEPRLGAELAGVVGFADYIPPANKAERSTLALLWVTLPPQHLEGRQKDRSSRLLSRCGRDLGVKVRIDQVGGRR